MKTDATGPGRYRVEHEGRSQTVYVAGPLTAGGPRWAFWNGRVYREETTTADAARGRGSRPAATATAQPITAPMPATVLKVLATAGQAVRKGDTLVIIEAMKMEMPLRASADATVTAVHCREGELVRPDALLVELT